MEKLHRGIAASEGRAYADALSILDSALPDNLNFTTSDATDWESRLGMITNLAVPLADRRAAIKRKMGLSNVPARQNYRFLEGQLQAAGFNAYVHENRFDDGMGGYVTKTPIQVILSAYDVVQLGELQLAEFQLGDYRQSLWTKIVNSLSESEDIDFNEGSNLRSTFFIGGNTVGSFANISIDRKVEFRQLILRVKPAQMVGYLLVNYI
jgi:hypothetical protein